MAQAFIDHAIKSNPHGNAILENQLRTLRNQIADTEFSDCDENLLVQAANEMELTYISESRKRKRKPGEDKNLKMHSYVISVIEFTNIRTLYTVTYIVTFQLLIVKNVIKRSLEKRL